MIPEFKKGSFPFVGKFTNKNLSLPMFLELTESKFQK